MALPSINIPEINEIWEKALHHTTLSRESRPPIENLVLEGGGVKGFAYIGALEVLNESGALQNLKRVAGSSAGGIVALLLAMGCKPPEIMKIMAKELDLRSLLDPRHAVDPTRIIPVAGLKIGVSDIWNLFQNKGLYKGDAFTEVTKNIVSRILSTKLKDEIRKRESANIRKMIQDGHNQNEINDYVDGHFNQLLEKYYIDDLGTINFEQLEKLRIDFPALGFKELFITGTRLSNATLKEFSAASDPNMSIVDAVRITMSFPFAFEPVLYQGEYYADGGIASNYPMDIFNAEKYLSHGVNDAKVNPCTLGLLVDSQMEIDSRWGVKKTKKDTFKLLSFAKKIIKGLHSRANDLKNKYSINSIQIFDNSLATLNLSLSEDNIAALIGSGRKALQEYVDDYMGEGVIYDNLPSYESVHDKYYAKRPEELMRIVEQKLWPAIQEINTFISLLKKVDFESELADIEERLSVFSQIERDEQYGIYLQLEETANELDNLRSESVIVDKKIRSYQVKIRNIIANIDEATHNSDTDKTFKLQNTLIDVIKKLSIAEEHRKSLEHERYAINENCVELTKLIRKDIFELIEQKEQLQYIKSNHVLSKLRNTESLLQEHLDIALHAISSHRRDYPDPRINDRMEKHFYEIVDEYYNEVVKIYREKDRFSEEELLKKAKLRSEFFADVLQFGIKIPQAKALTQHFYAMQDIMFRDHKHPLLDMQYESELRKIRFKFFRKLLIDEMQRMRLFVKDDSDEYDEITSFWEQAVNTYLAEDSSITQGYAEYLAKEKTIKHWQAILLRKQQQDYKTYKREAKQHIDVEYALSLHELSQRLGRGKWGDLVLIANRQDLKRNLMNTERINGEVVGVNNTEYSISTLQSKAKIKGRYKASNSVFKVPPIKAHVLVPKKNHLQNPVKKTKELIILFNEPINDSWMDEYSLAVKYSNRRKKQFGQFKEELMKRIQWSLRQMQEEGLQPDDAKIKITISGEGIAGQDAQYCLAAIIDEMNKRDNMAEFKRVSNIELILTDSAKVSESSAVITAANLHALKMKRPDLRIKNYNLIHQRQIGDRRRNKRMHNYLGQANILSSAPHEDATVIADFRDTHDSRLQHKILTNQYNPELLQKELNESKISPSNIFVRNINFLAKRLKNVGKFLCYEFIPKFVKFISSKIFSIDKSLNNMLQPFYRVAEHFKKKNKIEYIAPDWVKDLYEANNPNKASSVPIKDVVPLQMPATQTWQEKAKDIVQQSSPSDRLKRVNKPPIENIVLEGGGLLSYGYLGALDQLQQDGLLNNLKRIAGSSGGGIVAALYSLGYTPAELSDVLINNIRLKDYLDQPYSFASLDTLFEVQGMEVGIGGIISLFKNKGLYKGDSFKKLMEKLIEIKLEKNLKKQLFNELSSRERLFLEKVPAFLPEVERNKRIDDYLGVKLTDLKNKYQISQLGRITFKQAQMIGSDYPELKIKELFLTGTKVQDASLRVFSAQNEPDMAIADAVRITMSYPGCFMPVKYNDEYYVDGAVAGNYPMHIFDDEKYLSHGLNDALVNPCTLGLIIDNKQDIEARWGIVPTQIEEIRLPSLVSKVLQGIQNRLGVLRDKYNINTIQISDNVSDTDAYEESDRVSFNMTKNAMRKLVKNGSQAARFYNEQYNDPSVQYSNVAEYDNFMQKYADKSIIQLQRILEEEVNPLLNKIKEIEPELREKQLSLQHNINRLNLELSTFEQSATVNSLLTKQLSAEYEASIISNNITKIGRQLDDVDPLIAKEEQGKKNLLLPYAEEGSRIPPDIAERLQQYESVLKSLYENKQSHALRLSKLIARKESADKDLLSLQDKLASVDPATLQKIKETMRDEHELLLIEQTFNGQSDLLQEKEIINRALRHKGVKGTTSEVQDEVMGEKVSPLLLSVASLKVSAVSLISIHVGVPFDFKKDIQTLFPPHEWEHFYEAGVHQFRHKTHVDEKVVVSETELGELRISGAPISKLSHIANAYVTNSCDIIAATKEEAIHFMKAMHVQGIDIARINNVLINEHPMADLISTIQEIKNHRSITAKSRFNHLK